MDENFKYPVRLSQRPIFSEDNQLKSLADSNVMKALYKSRLNRRENDIYRPYYHFTCSDGYINDPNGPCKWRGRWHMFFQLNVERVTLWGHAVSDDLIRWQELPFAIYPGRENEAWSGAVWTDKDKAVAIYYGHGGEGGLYISTSSDPLLLNWTPIKETPVIPNPPDTDYIAVPYTINPQVYDPFIWREDGKYYVLSAGIQRNPSTGGVRRAEYVYESENLTDWKYLHQFIADEAYSDIGDDGGCPYFVSFNGRRMLLHYSHRYGARYVLGNFDSKKIIFTPTSGERINTVTQTSGYYAPAAWYNPDAPDEVYAIYTMHGTRQPAILSLPHRLTAVESSDRIAVKPAASYEKYRRNEMVLSDIELSGEETVLDDIQGNSLEIELELEYDYEATPELRVFRSEDGKEYTSVRIFAGAGSKTIEHGEWKLTDTLEIDCSHSGKNAKLAPPETIELPNIGAKRRSLHIFLDKSVMEIFSEGTKSIGRRVFPSEGAIQISALTSGGSCKISSIKAWELPDLNTPELIEYLN